MLQRSAERLLGVVEPVAGVARRLRGFFGGLASVSILAGIVLFLVLFSPFEAPSLWKVVMWSVVAVLLLVPGAVLGLFRLGLTQLIAIPGEVAESLGDVERRGVDAMRSSALSTNDGSWLRRTIRFVRSLVDVRTALLQSKELAVKASLLVRLANPITLVIVLGSAVAAVVIVSVACLAVLAVTLF